MLNAFNNIGSASVYDLLCKLFAISHGVAGSNYMIIMVENMADFTY